MDDATGRIRPGLNADFIVLDANPLEASPAALLGGAVPHEAARDPEELPLVQRAAVAFAERTRA